LQQSICEAPDIGTKLTGVIGLLLLAVPLDDALRIAGLNLPELGKNLTLFLGKQLEVRTIFREAGIC
jgi:hypothetical protein